MKEGWRKERQTNRKKISYLNAGCMPSKKKMDVFTNFSSTKTENLTGEKETASQRDSSTITKKYKD